MLRIFTATERAKAARRTERIQAATFAKRFAAKEAAAKALGTGFRRGVFFSDLGVVNLASGQPTLRDDRRRGGTAGGDHARGNGGRRRIDDDRRIPIRLCPGDHFGYGGEVIGCGPCDDVAATLTLAGAAALLGGCVYDPYTGAMVPCCGYYGYPYGYRYPAPYGPYGYPPAPYGGQPAANDGPPGSSYGGAPAGPYGAPPAGPYGGPPSSAEPGAYPGTPGAAPPRPRADRWHCASRPRT